MTCSPAAFTSHDLTWESRSGCTPVIRPIFQTVVGRGGSWMITTSPTFRSFFSCGFSWCAERSWRRYSVIHLFQNCATNRCRYFQRFESPSGLRSSTLASVDDGRAVSRLSIKKWAGVKALGLSCSECIKVNGSEFSAASTSCITIVSFSKFRELRPRTFRRHDFSLRTNLFQNLPTRMPVQR